MEGNNKDGEIPKSQRLCMFCRTRDPLFMKYTLYTAESTFRALEY